MKYGRVEEKGAENDPTGKRAGLLPQAGMEWPARGGDFAATWGEFAEWEYVIRFCLCKTLQLVRSGDRFTSCDRKELFGKCEQRLETDGHSWGRRVGGQ